jgi:GNAT superfamily N-acetyltransferase
MSRPMSVETGVDTARWPDVSEALAAAFQDDPVMSWLLPDAGRRAGALRRFFALETRHVALPHAASVAATGSVRDSVGDSGDTLGAALVLPPGHWRMPLRAQAAHAPSFLRIFGRRLPHALGLLSALERRHPRRPHYYLAYIGVTPAAQGFGAGGRMLESVVQRCDRERLPAYLEASSPRNAELYRRMGFDGIEVIRPFGAPPMELMVREPRP